MTLEWEYSRDRWELIQLVHKPTLRQHVRMLVATVNAKRPRRRRRPRYFIARILERRVYPGLNTGNVTTAKLHHDLEEAKAWAVAMVRLGDQP